MRCVTIIPVNNLSHCKTRLSSALNASRRAELVMSMLESVLHAVMNSAEITSCLVVSRETRVLELARRKGAKQLRESATGLNAAISEGIEWAIRNGADTVLILPADLPFLRQREVSEIMAMTKQEQPCVVIAPSVGGTGTNGLLLSPPNALCPEFGPDSFAKHLHQAKEKGVHVKLFHSFGTSRDIDNPEDLLLLETRCAPQQVLARPDYVAAIP